MTGNASHYFSSCIAQPYPRADERFWIPLRLTLPTVAPGQTPGALRFVSLALHILSQGRKAPQARFSEECFRPYSDPETRLSKARPLLFTVCTTPTKSCGIQQAWMNSRNQTTIATRSKHRQPVVLHPTHGSVYCSRNRVLIRRLPILAPSLYTTGFPIHTSKSFALCRRRANSWLAVQRDEEPR